MPPTNDSKGARSPWQRDGLDDVGDTGGAATEFVVIYDKTVDAAYVYLTEPQTRVECARIYPCDPVDVDAVINLDFDEQGRLIGIEVLAASSKLPKYLLQSAERLETEDS
ncbi:DUF2283 domain-containing protein [Streptomyces sp. NPDC005134]|uniref:DUF2283 domain-containing protein n=1 Tax=unclassified Streptomyces TaxID=2593676 RepID=UPI0033AA31FC